MQCQALEGLAQAASQLLLGRVLTWTLSSIPAGLHSHREE